MALLSLGVPTLLMVVVGTVVCCDEDSPMCFGMLYNLLAKHIPNGTRRILLFFPGGFACVHCCGATYDYVFFRPNPLMQIFYLGLVIGGFAIFMHVGLPMLPNARLGSLHLFLPFALVLWVLFTFVVASVAPPGYITATNQEALEHLYPYDGFLFVKQKCTTCGTTKVARSKHDRMLNRCVEKFDHFCPWINNSVGALNFRYFLMFVFSTAVFLVYGSYVLTQLLLWVVQRDKLWEVKFMHTGTNTVVDADVYVVTQYMIANHGMLIFIWVLCIVMGLTLVGFFLYQIYLVKNGTTANENAKWADIDDFYASKKWKRELDSRPPDYPADETFLSIDADPLAERKVKDFPSRKPRNIYNHGFRANMMEVIYPPSLVERKAAAINSRRQNSKPVAPANTALNVTDKETAKGSKDTVSDKAKKSKGNRKKGN